MTDKVIARVVVDRAGEMTEAGRADIANWLRQQADNLEEDGHNYSHNFVARYIINVEERESVDG